MINEKQLVYFNYALLTVGIMAALSSIQLEILAGKDFLEVPFEAWVWTHIIVCTLCMIGVILHLYLHWGKLSNWLKRTKSLNAKLTKVLTYLAAITFISGILVSLLFIIEGGHHTLGGVHGKFGLVVIVITLLHATKRFKWFRGRTMGESIYPVIDSTKCVGCGLCVKRCPAEVFTKVGKMVTTTHPLFCHQCTKCMTKCPKGAISAQRS